MNIYIETLGCTFNQADSQIMAGILNENEINIVDSIEKSDIAILNTCYVKHPTEHKVINKIKKFAEKYPNKKLIVSGCMVEIEPEKLNKIAPNINWIGPHQIKKVMDVVEATTNNEKLRLTGFSGEEKVGLPKLRKNPLIHIIQICEGCLGKCSYCCTKFARGKLQSYPLEHIKKEAQQALAEGCVEIQLTAQDTAAFGRDTGEKLSDLIKEIASLEGDFRIRVGMMHPRNMLYDLDNLIEAFKLKNVYKFIHMPIQSGNNQVLKDMHRGHNVEEFKDMVEKIRSEIPEISIATDIIVGYPTESEKAFNDTCDLIREVKPNFIHLSKYKHRYNTESSKLEELHFSILKKRSKYIESLKMKITKEDNLKLINSNQKVLIIEKGIKGGLVARTNSYIPVIIQNGKLGSFKNVKISDATSTYLKSSN